MSAFPKILIKGGFDNYPKPYNAVVNDVTRL